jgi:ATP-dependent helicase HrpB
LRGVAASGHFSARGCRADAAACRRVLAGSELFRKQLGAGSHAEDQVDQAGVLLAYAYPDRIAQRKTGFDYVLSGGRGAFFPVVDALGTHEYLAVATLDGAARRTRIFLAAPLERDQIFKHFAEHIIAQELLCWDVKSRAVTAERIQALGRLALRREPLAHPDPTCVRRELLGGIVALGIDCLPWTDDLRQWQARVVLLREVFGSENWPDVSDAYLAAHCDSWLEPFLGSARSLVQVQVRDLRAALAALLPPHRNAELDELAPRVIMLPDGSRARLQYVPGEPPVLSARIQSLFGMRDTPRVAVGRVKVLMHLMSPAMRPVQITADLEGFWKNSYHAVKKDLKGRYPKHRWPDDPLQAAPARRKPRK